MDPSLRFRLAPGVRLQTDPITGDPVVLNSEGLAILNETAHAILSHCDGQRTFAELIATLAEEYDASPDDLSADVEECLTDLQRRRLIEPAP